MTDTPTNAPVSEAMIDAMVEAWSDADAHHDVRSTCRDLLVAAMSAAAEPPSVDEVELQISIERWKRFIGNLEEDSPFDDSFTQDARNLLLAAMSAQITN